MHAFLALLKS